MKLKKRKKPFVARPWSISPCPTVEEVRSAWLNRRKSLKDFIWLLSVLAELTCYTDCNLEHLGGFGNIAGRKGGLKEYLETHLPELTPKYKSISRYVRLSFRIREAFNIYPPAALSLMHPELPLPERNMPFLTNYARQVYRKYFEKLPPTYVAFNEVVEKRLKKYPPKHIWGPPLPRDKWEEAETNWRIKVIAPKARERIKADHSFYARDWNRFVGHNPTNPFWDRPDGGGYQDRQAPDEGWARVAEYWHDED